MKLGLKHWGHFIILGIVVLAVYSPALTTFFAQDDFTHLRISRAESIREFLSFFMPRNDTIFYRPLSVQIYTWISRLIFGLNPAGYHAVALGFHLASVGMVYKLLRRWLKPRVAWLGALMYGVHPSLFMSLFWVAEFSMVIAPLLAFLAIWQFLERRWRWFYVYFTLGLLSNELVLMVPVILMLMMVKKDRDNVLKLLPAFGLSGLLILLRFVIKPASLGSEYGLSLNPPVWWSNLRWYIFRAAGLPEGWRAYVTMPEMVGVLVAIGGFWLIWATKITKNLRMTVWGIAWFVAALLPVLALNHHQSPIYQLIGLPWFILAVLSLTNFSNTKLWLVASGLWLIASFWSVRAQNQYHWVTARARLAKYHLEKLQWQEPKADETVIFLNTIPQSSTQVYLAMGGENAVKVFWGENVSTVFEDFAGTTMIPKPIYILSQTKMGDQK